MHELIQLLVISLTAETGSRHPRMEISTDLFSNSQGILRFQVKDTFQISSKCSASRVVIITKYQTKRPVSWIYLHILSCSCLFFYHLNLSFAQMLLSVIHCLGLPNPQ